MVSPENGIGIALNSAAFGVADGGCRGGGVPEAEGDGGDARNALCPSADLPMLDNQPETELTT